MAKIFIRSGDVVRVMRGNERGKEGRVMRVDREKGRLVVEGVNLRKPSAQDPEGGIVSFEAPIHVSNVMLIDPATGSPSRMRTQRAEDGTKERVAVKSGRAIPKA